MENQLSEAQSIESSSGLFSMMERGVAWMTTQKNQHQEYVLEELPEWKDTEADIKKWLIQLAQTLESFEKLFLLKAEEVEWNGPETEIDSV